MRRKALEIAAWAKQAKPRGVMKCSLCAHLDASEAVAEILRLRHAGESTVSIRQTSAFLRERFGRAWNGTIILNHCEQHLGTRWGSTTEIAIALQEKARARKRK